MLWLDIFLFIDLASSIRFEYFISNWFNSIVVSTLLISKGAERKHPLDLKGYVKSSSKTNSGNITFDATANYQSNTSDQSAFQIQTAGSSSDIKVVSQTGDITIIAEMLSTQEDDGQYENEIRITCLILAIGEFSWEIWLFFVKAEWKDFRP